MLLLAAPIHAHGGPPSALGIVAADANGQPNVVLLNEGLAVAREDRWFFACPRLWGDAATSADKVPRAVSVDGIDTYIIGTDDLYVARDGVLTAQGRPDLSSATIVALAGDRDALFGLSLSSAGSAVVRIDDDAKLPLFTSEEFWSALATDSARVHIARVGTGELVRLTLDRQGEVLDEFRAPIAGAFAQIRLRPTAQGLFAVGYDGEQYTLAAIEQGRWDVVLQSSGPIHGPQASAGGQLWVALDGELMRDGGDGFEPVGDARRVTCLDQWGSLTYACVGSDIHQLGDDGLQARVFELAQLNAPDPDRVPPAAARECEFQWLLYRNDLERSGLDPRDLEPGSEPADGSIASDAAAPPSPDAGAVDRDAANRASSNCSVADASARSAPFALPWAAGLGLLLSVRSRSRSKRAAHSIASSTMPRNVRA